MRKKYDFTGAKRARDVPHLAKLQAEAAHGKTRIAILIDDAGASATAGSPEASSSSRISETGPETQLEDLIGCTGYQGPARTPEEMDAGIARGAHRRRTP
ncbi:MAG TPA: hypothetical protein VEW48_08265 [Thermoanaerobaculia bacterium]|nr:hypothetical protein [Thermoanaerobaculia bacterium]